jgi:SAM-dependent methyltransferase
VTVDVHHDFAPSHDEVLAALAHYNEWLFGRARPHLGRRVLDAGAGTGTFVALEREAGASVVALEPHPPFASRLRARFGGDNGVQVVEADLERLAELNLAHVDSIVCFNVLEHVGDHRAALQAMRNQLVPGGRLLLLVPAHPALYGETDRAIGHERRYRRGELKALLVEAGFAVETLRPVNPVGTIDWFLAVRMRRRRDWPVTSFKTFDWLVPVLRHFDLLRLPFGLSLWAVARRGDD